MEKLNRKNTYPLGDRLTVSECNAANVKRNVLFPSLGYPIEGNPCIRGRWNGEFRKPKKGEWYLSGAKIATYRASNDLGIKFHIAKLVRVTTRTVETVETLELN